MVLYAKYDVEYIIYIVYKIIYILYIILNYIYIIALHYNILYIYTHFVYFFNFRVALDKFYDIHLHINSMHILCIFRAIFICLDKSSMSFFLTPLLCILE